MMVLQRVILIAGAGTMLAACAPQAPANLVSGLGERLNAMNAAHTARMQASRSGPQPLVDAAEQRRAALGEERLGDISPAAGPRGWTQPGAKVPEGRRASGTPQAAAAAVEPTTVTHTVKATDTAFKLARTYQTSVAQILRDNGLNAVSDIREGQVLTIAQNSKPQTSAWDDMRRALTEPTTPVAGQSRKRAVTAKAPELLEPTVTAHAVDAKLAEIEPAAGERPHAQAVNYTQHTVQPKETIYRISLKYNVSVLDIMAANEFTEPQDLKADTVIKVPVRDAAATQLAQPVPAHEIAPAAGVAASEPAEPVQVAMLGNQPGVLPSKAGEDLETKAVQQQAFKDSVLPDAAKEKVPSVDEAKLAEQKRGYVDRDAARADGLVWPVRGEVVRKFGDDGSGVARTGINIAVPKGTPVLASEGGKVLYADDGLKIYGKMVLVRHDNGMVSAYAHNSYLLVKKNERVKKGQVLALSGATGNVESPQLHFELRQHASAVDPLKVLPRL